MTGSHRPKFFTFLRSTDKRAQRPKPLLETDRSKDMGSLTSDLTIDLARGNGAEVKQNACLESFLPIHPVLRILSKAIYYRMKPLWLSVLGSCRYDVRKARRAVRTKLSMQELEKSISFDGRDIKLRVGLLAPQAGGAVLVQSGETAVLVTATRAAGREGIDFLPLLVGPSSPTGCGMISKLSPPPWPWMNRYPRMC
jgi:hypothetical protein